MKNRCYDSAFTLLGFALLVALGGYLLISLSHTSSAAYYDSTPIESRVNVTNSAPVVSQVILYESDDGSQASIDLEQGTTENLTCNATVDDLNGWEDIVGVNATIYDSDTHNSSSVDDKNFKYFTSSCTNETINTSALEFSCVFFVWYYANNATWNCNVSAIDAVNASDTEVDATPPIINKLVALNLSANLIDFDELAPGATTQDVDEPIVNVTNTGNSNFNLSVDGFGTINGDGLAMNCTSGNISIEMIHYNYTDDQNYDTSMWNLSDDQLPAGIPGLSILQRVDDNDDKKINSTNSTYWKLRIPVGSARGFCNGTVTFSAVVE